MLLEALIGLLIFSLGVLALVAMQSVSVSNVSNAKYRVEAAFLAEELMNYMWVDQGVPGGTPNVQTKYSWPGGNSPYIMNWVTRVQNAATGLPGAGTYPPTVVVTPLTIGTGIVGVNPQTGYQVTVTMRWKAPDALTPSNHVAQTFIIP